MTTDTLAAQIEALARIIDPAGMKSRQQCVTEWGDWIAGQDFGNGPRKIDRTALADRCAMEEYADIGNRRKQALRKADQIVAFLDDTNTRPAIVTALRQAEAASVEISPKHPLWDAAIDLHDATPHLRGCSGKISDTVHGWQPCSCYRHIRAMVAFAQSQAEAAPGVAEALDGPEHIGAWKHTDSHFWPWLAEQHVRPSTIKALRDGLEALARQHGARDGYVLVPREPTEAMLEALHSSVRIKVVPNKLAADIQNEREVYAAMIAAAPATDVGEG